MNMPTERDRETNFLRRCLQHHPGDAGGKLEERMRRFQRDERCVRRVSHLMALLAGVAAAGLVYGAVLLDDFPFRMSVFTSQFVIKALCALGLGSVICLLAFSGIGFLYRKELNRCRERGRHLVTGLLDSRLLEMRVKPRHVSLEENKPAAPPGESAAPLETLNLAKPKQA